jgi:hypothetical protein
VFDVASWGVVVAAAGVVLSAATYAVTRVIEWRASVAERRRQSVARVLAVAETSARNLRHLWRSQHSDLEFAILIPQLAAEHSKLHDQVPVWLARRG